jgi:solute:Na+ symporter, SSS family
MLITFGSIAIFFALIVAILQISGIRDRNFTEYAVGGRSFGANYQAMSFLNTWYPGAMFTAFGGMAASAGVISFYVLSYSLLTVVLMYLIARPVWVWGKTFDLRTQPDLLALRFNSRHIKTIAAVIGIASGIPWLVLGMQALGTLFQHMSLGTLSFSQAIIVGVALIALRQVWTVRMGMRGVVISDFAQGIVAYIVGSGVLVGLITWMVLTQGITFASLDAGKFAIPSFGSKEGPLYVFSLILTGTIGGWCWPYIFVRLFTADGVRSLKKSAAIAVPVSLIFGVALLIFGMLGAQVSGVATQPNDVWFIVAKQAGGLWLLGLAGVIVLAASMGHIDGNIQATGAQIANDLVGNHWNLDQSQLIIIAKLGMLGLTILSSWLACLELPALFQLAVLAYQGIIQLAVPQFLGLFWKRGNKYGAIASMTTGFAVAVVLELVYPGYLPWAYGLTSGAVGLVVNLAIYVAAAYLLPQSREERQRVEELFALVERRRSAALGVPNTAPQAA